MKCFCQEAEIFSGQWTKMIKIFNLLEKKISSKLFSGHLDIRYDNPTEIFLPKVANLLLELVNWIKIYVFKVFFLRVFRWTRKMQIRQPYWKISVKVLKQFGSMSKNEQKEHIFFPKKVFCPQTVPLDTQNAFLTNLPNFSCQISESFLLKIR